MLSMRSKFESKGFRAPYYAALPRSPRQLPNTWMQQKPPILRGDILYFILSVVVLLFYLTQRDDHERFHCRFRLVSCPNGCGEVFPHKTLGSHTAKHCSQRFDDCPLACGVKIRYRDIERHVSADCKNRLLSDSSMRALLYGTR